MPVSRGVGDCQQLFVNVNNRKVDIHKQTVKLWFIRTLGQLRC